MKRVAVVVWLALASVALADIDVPVAWREANHSGSQCVWSSCTTAARYSGVGDKVGNLTDLYRGTAGPGQPEGVLRSKGVRFWSQRPPSRDMKLIEYALAHGLVPCVGVYGSHMLNLSGIDDDGVRIIDNMDPRTVRRMSREAFALAFDGWCIVILPDQSTSKARCLPCITAGANKGKE